MFPVYFWICPIFPISPIFPERGERESWEARFSLTLTRLPAFNLKLLLVLTLVNGRWLIGLRSIRPPRRCRRVRRRRTLGNSQALEVGQEPARRPRNGRESQAHSPQEGYTLRFMHSRVAHAESELERRLQKAARQSLVLRHD